MGLEFWENGCTVSGNKDENYPTSSFKQMPISPFTITILCDVQSTFFVMYNQHCLPV
jgi:hypothetical protein